MKKAISIFAIIAVLFQAIPVLAYNVASQTTDSATVNEFGNESWGQKFVPTHSGTITSIDTYLSWSSGAGLFQASVYAVSATGTLSIVGSASSNVTVSNSKTLYTYTWASGNPTITAGSAYWVSFGGRTSGTNRNYGSATDIYSSGAYCRNISNSIGSCVATSTIADAYFQINTDNNTSTPASISFYATPTSTCDFYIWDTQSYYPETGSSNYYDAVAWGNDAVGYDYLDWKDCGDSGIGGDFILGTQDTQCIAPSGAGTGASPFGGVRKSAPLVPGVVYRATPWVLDDTTVIDNWQNNNTSVNSALLAGAEVASGNTWEFIVSGQPNENGCQAISQVFPDFSWPFASSTPDNPYGNDWCADMLESTIVQQIKKAGCQSAQYLFKPSEQAINNFYDLKSQLEYKPPFGYVTAYGDALSGITMASTTTSTLSTVTSSPNLQLAQWSQLGIIQTIRSTFGWFLYLIFGIWVFNRLRHFSLHG